MTRLHRSYLKSLCPALETGASAAAAVSLYLCLALPASAEGAAGKRAFALVAAMGLGCVAPVCDETNHLLDGWR